MAKIEITQGSTFVMVSRWETTPIVYKLITSITRTAPVRIEAAGHGLTDGWRVAIVSVQGMTEINAALDSKDQPKEASYHKATVESVDAISLNDVNAAGFSEYVSGGYLQYNSPKDMAGYSARMTIRDKIGGTALLELVSPGDIVIDNTAKTVTVTISATATAALTISRGVFDLEMVSGGGIVTKIVTGTVTVSKEVTT